MIQTIQFSKMYRRESMSSKTARVNASHAPLVVAHFKVAFDDHFEFRLVNFVWSNFLNK